jgi:hypothetical protein
VLTAVAIATYGVTAFAGLWTAPQTLWLQTPEAYSSFAGGSVFGIQMVTVMWTAWSAGWLLVVVVGVRRSNARPRGKLHRYVSIVSSAMLISGLVGLGAWVLWIEVDLAAEHVMLSENRDASALRPVATIGVFAVLLIVAALILKTVGAGVDRFLGPTRLDRAQLTRR